MGGGVGGSPPRHPPAMGPRARFGTGAGEAAGARFQPGVLLRCVFFSVLLRTESDGPGVALLRARAQCKPAAGVKLQLCS